MSEKISIRQRRREMLITLSYTIFSVFMIIVTAIENWFILYIPFISMEIAFVWWSYISKFKTYVIRAFVVTIFICMNVFMYGIYGENFYVMIPTLCVEIVLLSLYEMTQIMGMGMIQIAAMLVYQIVFHPDAMVAHTSLEQNRYTLQMLSLVVLIALCIYRIRHQIQEEADFASLEERVKAEQKIKDDFMANTSHELRTPINTVSGLCEILLQKNLPDDIHENVLDIQMIGVELQDIVTDIMDYAALEADTMELVTRPYNITSTLNDVMNMTMFENREKQLEIIFDCDPNIPRLLEGDEHQLRRVLNNLIGNAIKFTSEGGVTVKVSYRPEDYGINLIVSVRDTGVGIDLEEQETILRGFYQTDSDRNRKSSGMGLGLAISSALIKKMGGFLTVKSVVGSGSEFSFAVPQKVLDDQPCISLVNPGLIRLVWYYKPQSAVPSIRDSFVEHIKHFSDYFGIVSQQADSLEECKRRLSHGQGSYLILGKNEYMEDKAYFDEMSGKISIILVADRNDVISAASQIHVLYKPYNAMILAEIFNGRQTITPVKSKRRSFTAPTARILVVDDNLMNLKVVEGMLSKYRIKIVAASSGEEALEIIDSKDFDFVFMDHMMPGMDGVECFHHIREKEDPYFSSVPIIALTANAVAGSREMFLSEGFNDFIAKPVDSTLMSEILRKYIPAEKLVYEDDHKAAEGFVPERDGNRKEEAFENLEGIDKNTALMYCGTVEDFAELVEAYCKTGEEYTRNIKKAYESLELKEYALLAHTVKSSSKTLGAMELSELALGQELAAKDNDEDKVKENHERFISEYEKILKQFSEFLGEGEETSRAEQKNLEEKEDVLAGVNEKASNFDFDGAIKELNEIGEKA